MFDSHVSRGADLYRTLPRSLFLVDGSVDTPVPVMSYSSVFPYAYIPRLHSTALEFPLDVSMNDSFLLFLRSSFRRTSIKGY